MNFIIGLFTGPLKKLWGGLAIALAAAAGLWAYGRSKSREGASKERAKATEKAREAAEKRNEIEADVARSSDDDLNRRLRRWQRGNN